MIDERLINISDGLYRVTSRAVIVRDGEILLTIEVPSLNLYGIPGGGIDYGENDPKETLTRELKEELDLLIDKNQISDYPIHVSIGNVFTDDDRNKCYGLPAAHLFYRVILREDQAVKAADNDFIWSTISNLDAINYVSTLGKSDIQFLKSVLEAE